MRLVQAPEWSRRQQRREGQYGNMHSATQGIMLFDLVEHAAEEAKIGEGIVETLQPARRERVGADCARCVGVKLANEARTGASVWRDKAIDPIGAS